MTAAAAAGQPAPVSAAALADSLAPFGASRMLPGEAYTSAAVLDWERRNLFAGAWTCVGRLGELSRPAFDGGADAAVDRPAERAGRISGGLRRRVVNQCAVALGDVGVLLTLSRDGVRAFANVCRHRGHELLPVGGCAAGKAVVCPYHGWTYRLDGTLAAAARMRTVAGFDRADYSLVPLPVTVWHDWVFVNASGAAPRFADYVGGLAELIAPYRPERLRLGAAHRYDVAANWKILVENYHECYHCPLIHPELCRVSPPSSGANWRLPGAWVGGAMDLRPHAETMSLDGRSRGVPIPGAPVGTVRYVGLFPNLLVSAHPDYVMTHLLHPLAPDRTRVECRWYFPAGVADPAYAVDFWDVTNREDWAACESVQRGVASPHFRPGPLAGAEDAVYQWVNLVARAYRDPLGALAEACAG